MTSNPCSNFFLPLRVALPIKRSTDGERGRIEEGGGGIIKMCSPSASDLLVVKITVTSDLGHVLYLIESSILVSLKEITNYEVQDFGQNGK